MKRLIIGIISTAMLFSSFSCSDNKEEPVATEFKSVENFKKLSNFINSDEFTKKIVDLYLTNRSNFTITQDMVDQIQNQTGVTIDLSLDEINQIYSQVFTEITNNTNVKQYVQSSNLLSNNYKSAHSFILNGDGNIDVRNFNGFENFSYSDKDQLLLTNYLYVQGYGNRSNCGLDGVPMDCWIVMGLTGAAIGSSFGGAGALVGAFIGIVIGGTIDKL
jgi:hypothetical protein